MALINSPTGALPNAKIIKQYSIYRIYYSGWKTNIRPIVFPIWVGSAKIHALSINAPQMSRFAQMKFVGMLKRLMSVNGANKYPGAMMYRIFRMYGPEIVRSSYRTFWKAQVNRFTLLNYGLNSKEDFANLDTQFRNADLYKEGSGQIITKIINNFTNKSTIKEYREFLAKPK